MMHIARRLSVADNQLLVLTFDSPDAAKETLRSVRQVERDGRLSLKDTAVVTKAADGKVHVDNEFSSATEIGTVAGAILGPLLVFMFPIAGIAIGAASGAFIGRLLDQGVDDAFVKELKEELRPGQSALFLVGAGDQSALVAAVRGHQGKVYQTTVSSELEEELTKAMTRDN
jgi:uncharacterized membrane protein